MDINHLYELLNLRLVEAGKPTINEERFLSTITRLHVLGDIEIDNGEVKTTAKTD